jgi:hypothetical protein
MAINITNERLAVYKSKPNSLITFVNVVDSNQQISGAKVLFEIPYIYEN